MINPIAQHSPYYSNQLNNAAKFINAATSGLDAKIENIGGNKTLTIKSESGVVLDRISGDTVLSKMNGMGSNVDIEV